MTVPKAVLLSVLVAAAVFSALGLADQFQVGGIDAGSMVPGHAFAQATTDETAPKFSSAALDRGTGVLAVTFDEVIDAGSIDPAKFHVRAQDDSTGYVTLSIAELDTDTDSATVAFTLNLANLATVNLLSVPELAIDPSAVSDLNGNGFVGTIDVTSASYTGNFSVGSQDDAPTGIAFSPDGTKMFVVGDGNDRVSGYALSDPFDVTGAITPTGNFPVQIQDAIPTGIALSPDGTKMFVVGGNNDSVFGYALSDPFDVTGAITPTGNFSVGSQDDTPTGIAFSPDGTKMFVVGEEHGSVYEYALSDPFDVTGAITPTGNFSVGSQDDTPTGIAFSPDGTKMFVVGDGNDSVFGYALSDPFDVTGAITPTGNFSVGSQDDTPTGIALSPDGTKMFVVGDGNDSVFGYALIFSFDITVSGTPDATTSFVTTWETSAAHQRVTFPGSGAYTIDWGDDTTPTQATGSTSHRYAAAGTYTVSVAGGLTQFNLGDSSSDSGNYARLQSIEQWGNIEWTTMQDAFRGATNMVYNATDAPNLSGVTSMAGMFREATSFNGNLSGWDTSSVTSMAGMFRDAPVFNGNLSGWDTSSVTSMAGMFRDAPVFNGNISRWDTSSVTSMAGMFRDAHVFNGNISRWDTSSVTSMAGMFRDAHVFNGNISRWDTSSVTDMSRLFDYASAFNGDISRWDTSKVTDMELMFHAALNFNGNISRWDTSKVTDMRSMFSTAIVFNGDISGWDVSSVTDMISMFQATPAFEQNLGKWYVVLNSTVIAPGDVPGIVGRISAQNSFLDGHLPTYNIVTSDDSNRFGIVDRNLLNMTSADDTKNTYQVHVTASGPNLFRDGSNLRVLEVTVVTDGQANQLPTANAGPNQTKNEGDAVTLDGTGSSDSDGTIEGYSWTQTSGTNVALSNAAAASPTFVAPPVTANENLVFSLTVTDDDGATSAADSVTVTVQNVVGNQLPTANAGPNQTKNEGDTVTLDGTGSSDSDGTIEGYSWTQTSGTNVALSNAAAASPTFVAPPVTANENLVFSLTVTDDDGATSAADSVTVTVQNVVGNQLPTANAGPNQTKNEGDTVTLDGTGSSDSDGTIEGYSWTQTSGTNVALSNAAAASPTFVAPPVTANENLVFSLTVTDDDGATSAADSVTVTVNDVPVSDTTPPTPTVASSGLSDGDMTRTTPIRFTVTFDEPVTGFTSDGVTLGGAANPTLTEFSGSGRTYTVVVTPGNDGTVILNIPAGAARDTASNPSEAAATFTVNYDGTAPAPAVTAAELMPEGTPLQDGDYTTESPIAFTVEFGEAVTGFTADDARLGGTARPALRDFTDSGNGDGVYTFEAHPRRDGTVTVEIRAGAAQDSASNPSEAADTFTVNRDATGPRPTITSDAGRTTSSTPIDFSVSFDEPVITFVAPDIVLGGPAAPPNGSVGDFDGSGDSYTFTVTPEPAGGELTVEIQAGAVPDARGNDNFRAAYTTTYVPAAPTVASLKTGELGTILITLTETVLGVTFAGFTVSGVASDPDVISATPDGKVITLGLDGNMLDSDRPRVAYDSAQGGITDADGIPLADFERAVTNDLDTTPPAVRSAVARGTDGISVSFSEKITGSTDADDWTLSGAPGIMINTATLQGSSSSSVRLGLSGDIPDGKPELTLGYAGLDITDPAGNPLAEISDIPVRHPSDSRTRTSSVPVLDIHSVMESPYAQHVPKEILDAVGSSTHDPDAPIPPVAAGDPLEYPISINGHGYLLGGARNTLEPQTVRAGEETTITFTVYDSSPITHFTMYMNLHGSDDQYSDSDTYVRYDAGSVLTADPHGLMESSAVTIQADGDRQTATFTITFAGAMEQTNIVARLWNADSSMLNVQVLDAFEVVAASEAAATTTTTIPAPEAISDPEPGDTATAESGVGPGSAASPGTAMDVLKRWAGFAPEAATDAELLEALGLDYPGADIPGWVMTELGPLVAKGHVTMSEFIAALEYVLGEDA